LTFEFGVVVAIFASYFGIKGVAYAHQLAEQEAEEQARASTGRWA
jgi:hypothetical protein